MINSEDLTEQISVKLHEASTQPRIQDTMNNKDNSDQNVPISQIIRIFACLTSEDWFSHNTDQFRRVQ